MLVHINIGSNIGDRHALIGQAVAAIEGALGLTALRAPLVESAPWGYDSALPYLNLGIALDMPGDCDLLRLHTLLQQLQLSIDPAPHRSADGSYIDRAIDIDLIAAGSAVIDTPALTLPHPRMHLRPFVLAPMAALEPGWIHPLLRLTPAQMLDNISASY